MSDAGAGGAGVALPRWASPYLPRFQEILHALSFPDGFVLMPVEVPSEDVAHALAAWLTAQRRPVTVVEPTAEEAWRGLTPALFEAEPEADGVLMVIGRRLESEGMMWGLRLLNQRRDSIGRHLGCPLLWCGPREFLDATWRAAPDLWSVADVPKRLEPPGREPPPYPIEWVSMFEISTLYAMNAARLAERSEFAAARSAFEASGEHKLGGSRPIALVLQCRLDLVTGAVPLDQLGDMLAGWRRYGQGLEWRERAHSELTLAEVRQLLGDLPGAAQSCRDALARFAYSGDRLGEAYAHRAMGHMHVRGRSLSVAYRHYSEALKIFRRFDHRRGVAHVLRGLADWCLMKDRFTEAHQFYEKALSTYRDLGDRLGEANVQSSLGDLAALLDEGTAAGAACYLEALRIYREIGVPWGERLAEERLANLQPR